MPSGLPLWLKDQPDLLPELSVARARGGTVFHVLPEQWEAIVERLGGWRGDEKRPAPPDRPLGTSYRPANEDPQSKARDPFPVDPVVVDRGNAGHARAQNALAAYLRTRGIEPKSSHADDPDFDLTWEHQGVNFVAEVKSLTPDNEEKQLRLGLGQVLRYRHRLASRCARVVAVLVAERAPQDASWVPLCASLGVRLTWPRQFDTLFEEPASLSPTACGQGSMS